VNRAKPLAKLALIRRIAAAPPPRDAALLAEAAVARIPGELPPDPYDLPRDIDRCEACGEVDELAPGQLDCPTCHAIASAVPAFARAAVTREHARPRADDAARRDGAQGSGPGSLLLSVLGRIVPSVAVALLLGCAEPRPEPLAPRLLDDLDRLEQRVVAALAVREHDQAALLRAAERGGVVLCKPGIGCAYRRWRGRR
jgi:hypothetical protein